MRQGRFILWPGALIVALNAACTGSISAPGASAGAGGVSQGAGGAGQPPGTKPDVTSAVCAAGETPVEVPRRLVRLSFNQLANSVRGLLGDAAADAIATKFEIGDPAQRAFPALTSPREGTTLTDAVWAKEDGIAAAAAQYVRDNFAAVTGCPTATEACAKTFLTSFAEKAYRHPLSPREAAGVLQLYTEVAAAGATVPEAVQLGVQGVLDAPQFVYRTELGAPGAAGPAVALAPHELAAQLSFFITDGPPDAALLDAAAQGRLASAAGIGAEVDRLLATDAARTNLRDAIFTYFSLPNLDNVVIDPAKVPEFNVGLKNAMYRESQEFLSNVLWTGTLGDLLTSRRTRVNADLAALYGVSLPAGVAPGPDGFVPVELPATRAGLLTQPGFLTARARTDKDSVVGRGLLVLATVLCGKVPPPPEALKGAIAAATTMLADKTERQKAEYRAQTSPCFSCHASFDPYGLLLEPFDVIGRSRTVDELKRPIDPTTALPGEIGGGTVHDVVDLANRIATNGAFASCMAQNVMRYALADVTTAAVDKSGCAVQTVTKSFLGQRDQTFPALIREIAVSQTLAMRSAGGQP